MNRHKKTGGDDSPVFLCLFMPFSCRFMPCIWKHLAFNAKIVQTHVDKIGRIKSDSVLHLSAFIRYDIFIKEKRTCVLGQVVG